jgi:hypothetical protein
MGIRLRTVLLGALAGVVVLASWAPPVGALSSSDQQLAQSGVLMASDLPTTYTETPRDASSDSSAQKAAAKIPACKKLGAFMRAVKGFAHVNSADFDEGQTSISNGVTVFPSAAKAKAALTGFASAGLPVCFDKFVPQLASSAGGSAVAQIQKVSDVTAGDQAVAYEGPVQITESDGTSETLAFGYIAIRTGRGVDVYSFTHTADSDISAVLDAAVGATLTRLTAALSGQ